MFFVRTLFLQIQRLVYEERTKAHSADKLRSVEDAHLNTNGSSDSFMQANLAYADKKGAQRIIIFGFHELLQQLTKRDVQFHIDATFTVPKGFYQCLIIGSFSELGVFLPCAYILMTRKNRMAYELAFSQLNILLGLKMKPGFVVHDFEKALYRAIKSCFPSADLTGCFFHWAKAISGNMIKAGFPKEVAFREVKRFFLLCVVEPEEVFTKALPWIEYNVLVVEGSRWTSEDLNRWNKVFHYMKNFWDNEELVSLFNYSGKAREL